MGFSYAYSIVMNYLNSELIIYDVDLHIKEKFVLLNFSQLIFHHQLLFLLILKLFYLAAHQIYLFIWARTTWNWYDQPYNWNRNTYLRFYMHTYLRDRRQCCLRFSRQFLCSLWKCKRFFRLILSIKALFKNYYWKWKVLTCT